MTDKEDKFYAEGQNYRTEVMRTATRTPEQLDDIATRARTNALLLNAAMGLAGEGGEASELVKKHVFHGAPLDRDKFIKELGDVRWYLELAAREIGVDMEEIERRNIAKLRERYPNSFNTVDSIKRADNKEGK